MLGYCPDPDERRAPGPHSLVGFYCYPMKLIRLSRRGSNPLHINAGSASVILRRLHAAYLFLSNPFSLVDGFGFQFLSSSNLKSSPYFNTAHASRAFFAAMAITARQ